MKRVWTESEIQALGTMPDFELGRRIGRPGKAVWAKRRSLGIPDPTSGIREWTDEEDQLALSVPVAEAAKLLNRTVMAVKIRCRKLRRKLAPEGATTLLTLAEVKDRLMVSPYDSKTQEERLRFVGGPYSPPLVEHGCWLRCKIRGRLHVGGYSNALIPWPTAIGHARQLIICADLLTALRTESRVAVCFHFGLSPQTVSELRSKLGIERLTAGSTRLFWRTIDLARTDEARAKISRKHEGRADTMTAEERERLRQIQRQPKSEAWKRKMATFWKRRFENLGSPEKWTEEELEMIGTMSDRDLARVLDRSLASVKAKKFQLLQTKKTLTNPEWVDRVVPE
jgi:hypothetical protein